MATVNNKKAISVNDLVTAAVLTALVVVFQLLATFTAFFGPFSTAMALIPIAIGAILLGPSIGAWLGFVFGAVVLASGGAAFFLTYDIPGTIITVLLKGTACGFAAGWMYRLLKDLNKTVATIVASITCPLVNTSVFLLGCRIFFMDSVKEIATALGSADYSFAIFWGLAMANFLIELGVNGALSPIITRIIDIKKRI